MKSMGYAQALDHSARSRGKKPELHHVEIEAGEKGGHIVSHHFGHDGPYREAERYPFEAQDGPKPKLPEGHPLAHIAKHMGMAHEIIKGDSDAKQGREEKVHEKPGHRSANPAAE